jgi:hypothetical protein
MDMSLHMIILFGLCLNFHSVTCEFGNTIVIVFFLGVTCSGMSWMAGPQVVYRAAGSISPKNTCRSTPPLAMMGSLGWNAQLVTVPLWPGSLYSMLPVLTFHMHSVRSAAPTATLSPDASQAGDRSCCGAQSSEAKIQTVMKVSRFSPLMSSSFYAVIIENLRCQIQLVPLTAFVLDDGERSDHVCW